MDDTPLRPADLGRSEVPEPREGSAVDVAVPPVAFDGDETLFQPGAPTRGRTGALVVGLVALVAAAVFAGYFLLTRANTPDDAILELFDAIEREDLLGIAASIAPSEHDFLMDPLQELLSEAERLGFLAGVDREAVGGVDLGFDELATSTEELADDLAWVAVSGIATSQLQPSQLPTGPLLDRYLPAGWADEIDTGAQSDDFGGDFGLAVVKEDGTWYVSLTHTVAEAARRESDAPFPVTQPFAEPTGADSPAAALEAAVLSIADLDLYGLIDVMAPGETAAFRRYSGLFMDDWDEAIDEVRKAMVDAGFTYSVDEVTVVSEDLDDGTVAWIEDVPRFSARLDDPAMGEFSIDRDGDCVRVLLPDEEAATSLSALLGEELDTTQFDGEDCVDLGPTPDAAGEDAADPFAGQEELLREMPIMGPLFEQWSADMGGVDSAALSQLHIVVVEHDGRWFVSPIGTMWRGLFAFTATLDQAVLEEVGDEIRAGTEDPDFLEQRFTEWLQQFQGSGALGPLPGEPIYGADVLAPYANQENILLIYGPDVATVTNRIGVLYGDELVLRIIDGPDLHAMFEASFGPWATAGTSPLLFPSGVVLAPVDVDTLVAIFNWFEIVDMYRAVDLLVTAS